MEGCLGLLTGTLKDIRLGDQWEMLKGLKKEF